VVFLLPPLPAVDPGGSGSGDAINMFSQNQEDRMIQAVFGRIGVKTRKFVEFGFGFLQNNTLRFALRHRGSGLYVDGSKKTVEGQDFCGPPFL
jgi:hypothetical protein